MEIFVNVDGLYFFHNNKLTLLYYYSQEGTPRIEVASATIFPSWMRMKYPQSHIIEYSEAITIVYRLYLPFTIRYPSEEIEPMFTLSGLSLHLGHLIIAGNSIYKG